MGNAIYRDIVRMSLMVDARHAIIAVPIEYKYGKKATVSKAYEIGTTCSMRSGQAIGSNCLSRGYSSSATEHGLD